MTEQLKRCPFCGKRPKLWRMRHSAADLDVKISCENSACQANPRVTVSADGVHNEKAAADKAAMLWNRRWRGDEAQTDNQAC